VTTLRTAAEETTTMADFLKILTPRRFSPSIRVLLPTPGENVCQKHQSAKMQRDSYHSMSTPRHLAFTFFP